MDNNKEPLYTLTCYPKVKDKITFNNTNLIIDSKSYQFKLTSLKDIEKLINFSEYTHIVIQYE